MTSTDNYYTDKDWKYNYTFTLETQDENGNRYDDENFIKDNDIIELFSGCYGIYTSKNNLLRLEYNNQGVDIIFASDIDLYYKIDNKTGKPIVINTTKYCDYLTGVQYDFIINPKLNKIDSIELPSTMPTYGTCTGYLEGYLTDTSIWAYDENINDGYPHIKEMYWKSVVDDSVPPSYSFEWSFNESNETATLVKAKINGNIKNIEIPQTVKDSNGNEYTVVAIGNMVGFEGNKTIETINLPSTLTIIGERAFKDCVNLKNINLNNVTQLSYDCFHGCTSLEKVEFSKDFSWLGASVFEGCQSLEYIDMSACDKLTKMISNGVSGYGGRQFKDCKNLKSIKFPANMSIMPENILSGCSSLEELTIPFIGKDKNDIDFVEGRQFGYIFGTSKYDDSYQVAQRYNNQAEEQYKVYYIPKSLTKVTVLGGYIKDGKMFTPFWAFQKCSSLKIVNLPDEMKVLSSQSFDKCSNLESVNISNVVELWWASFRGCSSLKNVTISGGLLFLSSQVFEGCVSLTKIYYSNSISQWKILNINNQAKVPGGVVIKCSDGDLTI